MENTPSGVSGQSAQQLVEEEPKHAIAPALIPHLRMAGNPVLIKDLVQRLRPKAVMSNLVQVVTLLLKFMERFHSSELIAAKESVYIRKELNSQRIRF